MSWYFFGPKRYHQAELDDGFQVIKVTVTGGYSPNVIQVRPGTPVRLLFDRRESGDCSSRVVIPDFTVNQVLPAVKTTSVELVPEVAGEYEFACGMSMIHGKVRAVGEAATPVSRAAASAAPLARSAVCRARPSLRSHRLLRGRRRADQRRRAGDQAQRGVGCDRPPRPVLVIAKRKPLRTAVRRNPRGSRR